MILLPCDEAFAFDYLSILYVKREHGLPVDAEIVRVERLLEAQAPAIMPRLLASTDFVRLMNANRETFEAVVKSGQTLVQTANRRRFRAKKRIQAKYWPTQPLMERKRKGDW